MAKEYKDLVVGLDIGTAKIMAVVAEVLRNGELRIAGLGVAPSHGLKRGVVVNIDATVQSMAQVADPASRTRIVRLEMANERRLPAGLPVEVMVPAPAGTAEGAVAAGAER